MSLLAIYVSSYVNGFLRDYHIFNCGYMHMSALEFVRMHAGACGGQRPSDTLKLELQVGELPDMDAVSQTQVLYKNSKGAQLQGHLYSPTEMLLMAPSAQVFFISFQNGIMETINSTIPLLSRIYITDFVLEV